ncbi:DUF7133 domain-containing protein [Cyclobacterium qasimii]|uniref:Cytochrome c domain-containing protein n=2 Tax=Cyclobacterium qasimii TaxID=1350429 RepID=S7WQN6_9BACT|nr:c-type cytochrome [Cyclobacterium qasimii]EPR69059.1 hypothetical protein ADICYQ_1918 [Cyclobacterium qasimii M12-11B]GEO20423.1 dehydrogenase [Cyclobacterium qasimii]
MSPVEAIQLFEINDDLSIQLVAAEPLVEDPVFSSFDEDGRLWVVEMRGFMNDITGSNELEPNGRISILEDTDGDGLMDISSIYLDSIIMPRALAVVKGGALVVENMSLWWTQDLDGDLKADTKVLIDPNYAGSDLPEHSGNGLLKGLDNWYYNAKSRFRYKFKDNQWIKETTEFRGQWGISQDDYGRLYYNYNWSPLHVDLVPPNYFTRNDHHSTTSGLDHGLTVDRGIFPIRENLGINRGYIPGILDDKNRLKEFTSACSPFYFREDGLPKQYKGNVFVCEPSGNLIRRNAIISNGIQLSANSPDVGHSMIASHDERFRPVSLTSGPDGALYITDMYRGLIQHGAYISPYLKDITIKRKLVQPTHYGRIWRVSHKDWQAKPNPKLSRYTGPELVATLTHPNGWYRDMSQRLLIERNDSSTLPLLRSLALNRDNPIGQIHALWTLEGLERLDENMLFSLLEKPEQQQSMVYVNALRLAEQSSKTSVQIRMRLEKLIFQNLGEITNEELALQMILTAGSLSPSVSNATILAVLENTIDQPIFRDAAISSLTNLEFDFLLFLMKQNAWQAHTSPKAIFLEMLSTAISRKNNPKEMQELVTLLEQRNPSKDWQALSIFTGMAMAGAQNKTAPINLKSAPKFLETISFIESNLKSTEWDNLFNWPGKEVKIDSLLNVNQLTAAEKASFAKGRQHFLSTCSGCHGGKGEGVKRMGPPLNKSEWVTGNETQLAMILLHGLEGPISVSGIKYSSPDILPVMPSMASLDNGTIANILTYIRNEWDNKAKAVKSSTVADIRISTQGRVFPWKPEELLLFKTPVNPSNKP